MKAEGDIFNLNILLPVPKAPGRRIFRLKISPFRLHRHPAAVFIDDVTDGAGAEAVVAVVRLGGDRAGLGNAQGAVK